MQPEAVLSCGAWHAAAALRQGLECLARCTILLVSPCLQLNIRPIQFLNQQHMLLWLLKLTKKCCGMQHSNAVLSVETQALQLAVSRLVFRAACRAEHCISVKLLKASGVIATVSLNNSHIAYAARCPAGSQIHSALW